MKEIVLYGAGGHCYAALELISSLKQYVVTAIIDDNPTVEKILGVPVVKSNSNNTTYDNVCISIGDNHNRKKIAGSLVSNFPKFCHESAAIYQSAIIGDGTLVLPNSTIDAAVTIGKFCIINNGAVVSHNAVVGDYSHIAINVSIAGGVEIGKYSLIGAGSIILPNVKIGKNVTIGAGTIVTKDVKDNVVFYGNPAIIKKYKNLDGR